MASRGEIYQQSCKTSRQQAGRNLPQKTSSFLNKKKKRFFLYTVSYETIEEVSFQAERN